MTAEERARARALLAWLAASFDDEQLDELVARAEELARDEQIWPNRRRFGGCGRAREGT